MSEAHSHADTSHTHAGSPRHDHGHGPAFALHEPGPPACDFCDEGVKRIFGWHEIPDPEGIEGTQRIKCPRFEYDQAHA